MIGCGLWQLPPAYDYALSHPLAHALEHATLLVGGFLVWRQLLDPEADAHGSARSSIAWCTAFCGAGLIAGGILLLSPAVLYGAYTGQPERLFGLGPHPDQQLAGLIVLGMQFVMLTVGLRLARPPKALGRSERLAAPATRGNRGSQRLAQRGSAVTTELSRS